MSSVDVIVPCYSYAHYLRGCVESVLDQMGVDLRVLIIDDASPDSSGEIAEELGRQDGRVNVRRHSVNQGHIATYNEGLDWLSADYALLISADDLLVPGALLRAAMVLDAHTEVGLVFGRQIVISSEDSPKAVAQEGRTSDLQILTGTEFIAECCRTASNPVCTPTAIVRTSLWKRLGGYRKELPHTGDMELWLRFAAHAAVALIDADQAYKRMHASSMQHQYLGSALGDLPHRQAALETAFREYGGRIADAARLRARAVRALAEQAFWAASRAFDRGDAAACQQCLDYALRLDPGLPDRPQWARLHWKRQFGPRLWSMIWPLVERCRRSSQCSALTVMSTGFVFPESV